MALVCDDDMKSGGAENPPFDEKPTNDDLEDGEIEDDDEEEEEAETAPKENEQKTASDTSSTNNSQPLSQKSNASPEKHGGASVEKRGSSHERGGGVARHDKPERRKHEEKKKHLTEAEKSVMHLHKLERMEREKREKYKRDTCESDDFASNLEKAIASVLKKNQSEGEVEEKRGRKRKKEKNRKKQSKKIKTESPKSDDIDESEMMNVRGGSPEPQPLKFRENRLTPDKSDECESYDSEYSSERSAEDRKERKPARDYRSKNSGANNQRQRMRDRRDRKYRDRSRDKKPDATTPLRDGNICIYNLQGKCSKGDDCPYNHDVALPMKLELCKFYLMGCCAKREKCLYLHGDFPCKFYHTGITCYAGDDCKFAHGKPLSEPFCHILLKHIETAPKEILGDFPRLSREGARARVMQAQKNLEIKYGITEKKETSETASKSGIPSLFDINIPVPPELMQTESEKKEKNEKPQRSRPSRWQNAEADDEKSKLGAIQMGFLQKDQDMRLLTNGDIDMRTLAPLTLQVNQPNLLLTQLQLQQQQIQQLQQQLPQQIANLQQSVQQQQQKIDLEQYQRDAGLLAPKTDGDAIGDVDIRNQYGSAQNVAAKETEPFKEDDDRNESKDVDVRRYSTMSSEQDEDNNADEPALQIVVEEEWDQSNKEVEEEKHESPSSSSSANIPANLPKTQRDLFMRIQAQQKENTLENQEKETSDNEDANVDWYSDDEDDQKLTIKMDDEKDPEKPASPTQQQQQPQIKPQEIVDKLGDLSKLDISAEVTKLLSSISQSKEVKSRDPRQAAAATGAVDKSSNNDPRLRRPSNDRPERVSIYEQGLVPKRADVGEDDDMRSGYDTDLRSGSRPDVDLRQLNLPFKAIENYTPASEIDASLNSHPPIQWKVYIVDIPKPDYTGLKLNAQDAQANGDPRLRKIFRLSTDEKDSPASPKQSPKASYGSSVSTSAIASGAAPTQRVDPRRRKTEENKTDAGSMTYAQQLTMLQTSPFYQNLTSNQKVMLNQELSQRADQSGNSDPTLSSMLINLGLIQNSAATANGNAGALSILTSLNNLNPIGGMLNANMMQQQNPSLLAQGATTLLTQNQGVLHHHANAANMLNANATNLLGHQNLLGQTQMLAPNPLGQSQALMPNAAGGMLQPNLLAQSSTSSLINQMAQSVGQPGLLGAAPGIPNLPPSFEINFDPRNGGLLGNAPYHQNYQENNSNFNNFNDDFYEGGNFNNSSSNNAGGSNNSNSGNNRNENRGFRDSRNNASSNNNNNRRGGRNFNNNRNNVNRNNFRNRNRSNRGHTPP